MLGVARQLANRSLVITSRGSAPLKNGRCSQHRLQSSLCGYPPAFGTVTTAEDKLTHPPRYTGPEKCEMDPEQRAIHAQIVESRSTGAAGPFGPWLANPAVAQPSQELGRVVRYETSFPIRVSELAILVTAARTRCGTEWAIHCREARKAGLTDEIIGHLLAGTATAEHFDDPLDRAVWRFADELTQQCRVSDDVYDELVATTVGTKGAVELVALCGYYTYVAMTLNVFRIPPPKNYL